MRTDDGVEDVMPAMFSVCVIREATMSDGCRVSLWPKDIE